MSSLSSSQQTILIRRFGTAIYFLLLFITVVFLGLGAHANIGFSSEKSASLLKFGASIHKYPLFDRYVFKLSENSPASGNRVIEGKLLFIENCQADQFSTRRDLLTCADLENKQSISIVLQRTDQYSDITLKKLSSDTIFPIDWTYIAVDLVFVFLSLFLSLLLFTKARHYLSGYLFSLVLLLSIGESHLFYLGSDFFNFLFIESARLILTMVIGPLSVYFFPQSFKGDCWKTPSFYLLLASIMLMLYAYVWLSFQLFIYAVSLTLLVVTALQVVHFRSVLALKEKKQVLTMVWSIFIAMVLYISLMSVGNKYTYLVGIYTIPICTGLGILFALMKYGLWQVETLISKSATLSLLSVIAFSIWAGLDQGMQALLNQTIGLSNTTVTAFLAAAISSLFAVPAYNYVSKSCDAFFNKNLYQLKRLLSKDILVLAEVQKLNVFVQQLAQELLKLSGAVWLNIEFVDSRLSEPHKLSLGTFKGEEDAIIREEHFNYQIDHVLSVAITLRFADRRINREIKEAIDDGVDEIARAFASCARWNRLETQTA